MTAKRLLTRTQTHLLADPQAEGRGFIISQTLDSPQQKYMVRTGRWKYVYHEVGGVEELYDVNRADYELYNLAADPGMADDGRWEGNKLAREFSRIATNKKPELTI